MNRTLIAMATLLSLGAAAPQAFAQAQTQPPPVVTPPAPAPGAGSLTTQAQVDGRITQFSNNPGRNLPARQTLNVASIVAVSGTPGTIDTRATLIGSVTQSRGSGSADPQVTQLVELGSVRGRVDAASVRTNGVLQGDISQSMRAQQAGQGNVTARQVVDLGGVGDASGQSLVTSVVWSGSVTQVQDRASLQEVRLGTINNAAVQDARAVAAAGGTVTQTTTVGAPAGINGSQILTLGAIDGVQAQSVSTQGTLSGNIGQTHTGLGQQRIDVGSVIGASGGAAAGNIATRGSVRDVTQESNGHGQQTVAVARVFGSSATNADATGLVTGSITQTSGGPISAGGNQFIGVGNIEGGRGNVVTDAAVSATLGQTRTGSSSTSSGAPTLQTIGIGSARGTTGVVRTRARVSGSVSQIADAARNLEQKIEIGSVVGSGANVSTDATFNGNILQGSNSNNQEQTIRIGSVVSGS